MDDRLRALERAARADPTDGAAGWAFVRALDQAGDVVGAWRERCRLARGGDEGAWGELEGLPAGLREPGPVRSRELSGSALYMSVSESTTVVACEDETVALDSQTLATRWTAERSRSVLAAGALVLHSAHDVPGLVVRDGRDGRELGRTALDAGEFVGRVWASADLAVLHCFDSAYQPFVLTVDLADRPGAVLARHETPSETLGMRRGLRLVSRERGPEALDPVTGEHRYVLRGARVVADADGVVVARSASLHEDKLELAHVDGRTGKETWSASSALPSSSKVALTGDHVVALRVELSGKKVPLTMEGFDRRTGARCWSMRDEFALVVQTEIAAARDVVYVSSVPGHFVAGRLTTVLAIEAATGTILWSRDVDLDTAALVRAWNVQLHPCRGALLIGAGANGVHIARLGAAP